jgi:hypothetical protein
MRRWQSPIEKARRCWTIAALAAVGLGLAAASLVAAQATGLRTTMRMEIVRLTPPAAEAPDLLNPEDTPNFDAMFAQMGEMLVKMIAPTGKVEMVWMAQAGAARSELKDDMLMMPSGTVMLMRGSDVHILDPTSRTYYVAPGPPAAVAPFGAPGGAPLPKPQVTVRPTGQKETMLGRIVERVDIDWRLPLPTADLPHLPPGFPTEMTMSIESWEAEIAMPEGGGPGVPAEAQAFLSAIGMSDIMRPGRFPMRTVLRGSMFPGFEMRTTVLELEEGPLPEELFAIPEGYEQVEPPKPPMPGDLRGEP